MSGSMLSMPTGTGSDHGPAGSSAVTKKLCERWSSALPICVQVTRSADRKIGMPGKYENDEVARK
jgi:hypothetical protein